MNDLSKKEEEYFLRTYKRIPLEILYGEDVYLFTTDGKKYFDFFSGLAVNALGYGNPLIIQAIDQQIKKHLHLSNYYISSTQIELAELLLKYSGLSKVFFANSGTEAIEASLKLIRKAFGPEKKIISFSNAFHGRTYGSLSLGGKENYRKHFSPLLPNIMQLEFNNISQLEENINNDTGAVYIEFIQGEGGIRAASLEFVKKLIELKNKYEFVLVADEVQSGIGRTGKPFAYNHFLIEPDIIIVAKAIGGGLPLGAMIVSDKYSNVFQYGDHGSTFGGNPVACAAGIVVIKEVLDKKMFEEVAELGDYFLTELNKLKGKYPEKIREVRGMGFMLGVEMKYPCKDLVGDFLDKGVLINCTNENVLRILPPLISTKENINQFLDLFNDLLSR